MNSSLHDYLDLLENRKASLEDYKSFEPKLKQLTILDVFTLFNQRLAHQSIDKILPIIDPFIHAVDHLMKAKHLSLPKDTILDYLDQENKALALKLNHLQDYFKSHVKEGFDTAYLYDKLSLLEAFNTHYVKVQSLLFPSLEKVNPNFIGLKLLWALQDNTKNALKTCLRLLIEKPFDEKAFNFALGNYFFKAFGLIQKESSFLLQASLEYLTKDTLDILTQEMFDYPFVFIEKPIQPFYHNQERKSDDGFLRLDTGSLDFNQLKLVINNLPLDITLIDEKDQVVFFNKPKDRLFPRSSAVLGRDVRNCHPAASVSIVENILTAFKTNAQDEAKFWFQMRGHFVYVRYLALRDEQDRYKGCLEITQLVEDIRHLEGEQRLLQWQK